MHHPSAARTARSARLFAALAAIAFAALCAGCSSTVAPATSHPRISGDQVQIYADPPRRYEVLGTLKVPIGGNARWDKNGNADAAFDELKSSAGALGGNGILLQAPEGAANAVAV